MTQENLYGFLNPEHAFYSNCLNPIIITLDKRFASMQAIYDYIGSVIYQDCTQLNPIFEDSTYFGKNFDGFHDCLRSYYFYLEKPLPIRFNIVDWHEKLGCDDLFKFMLVLSLNIEENRPIQVFISKKILSLYLQVCLKLDNV